MKSTIFTLCLFLSSFAFAQVDLEETMDNIPMVDNTVTNVNYKISGVFQVKDESCTGDQFTSLKFPGGTTAYTKELYKKLADNVNWNYYAANGEFNITLTINKKGEVTNVDAGPKVANSEDFLQELKDTVKKVKTKWIPAKCNSNPIESKAVIKLDFTSMSYDSSF